MASNVFVIDSSFRRTQIKVQPNTYLRTVLEEACAKSKLDPDQYTLKSALLLAPSLLLALSLTYPRTDKNKQLDLSLTFRLSGLSPGAKLQLTQASRSPSVVNVALNLPAEENNIRLQDKFPSNTSLWLVLRKFEEGVAGQTTPKLNLTSRGVPSTQSGSGRLNYEQPCLNIMGRELTTFTHLQRTLAQLGYNSGSLLLRLTFKQDGTPMDEAMAQISNYFNSVLPATSTSHQANARIDPSPATGSHATAAATMESVPDATAENAAAPQEGQNGPEPSDETIMTPANPLDQTPVDPSGLDVLASSSKTTVPNTTSQPPSVQQESPATSSTATHTPAPSFTVYAAPSNTTPQAALAPHSDADFAPSVEHAHAHQAVLNRLSQNKRLASDRELAASATSRSATLAAVKTVTIRVRFPDQMFVEKAFGHDDNVTGLYEQVRGMMDVDDDRAFELRYQKGNGIQMETLDPSSPAKLISDLGLVGKVLVTMLWLPSVAAEARQRPVLNAKWRDQAVEMKIPEPVVAPDEGKKSEEKGSEEKKRADAKKKNLGSKADVEARLKKMMGFGKK